MSADLSRRSFLAGSLAIAGSSSLAAWATESQVKDIAWLKEIQTPPAKSPKSPDWKPLLVDADGNPISSAQDWQKRREELLTDWLKILGSLGLDNTRRPELKVLETDSVEGVVRERVEYEVEPGLVTQAYILRPSTSASPGPGVAVFHSTVNHSILQPAGLGPDLNKAFGLRLAQRGCTCICPRNFLWPDNQHIDAKRETEQFQKRHPQATGMAKMLYDSVLAVNILQSLPSVDANRLGAVGHSLGAKEVLYLAAFDARIKATVSSEGGIGLRFSNWNAPWYLGPKIDEPTFGREHHELLACIAPRAFLLVGGESADGDKGWPFIEAALPVYRLYGGTPRVGQFNHRLGHAVPPVSETRIYEWMETYL